MATKTIHNDFTKKEATTIRDHYIDPLMESMCCFFIFNKQQAIDKLFANVKSYNDKLTELNDITKFRQQAIDKLFDDMVADVKSYNDKLTELNDITKFRQQAIDRWIADGKSYSFEQRFFDVFTIAMPNPTKYMRLKIGLVTVTPQPPQPDEKCFEVMVLDEKHEKKLSLKVFLIVGLPLDTKASHLN